MSMTAVSLLRHLVLASVGADRLLPHRWDNVVARSTPDGAPGRRGFRECVERTAGADDPLYYSYRHDS